MISVDSLSIVATIAKAKRLYEERKKAYAFPKELIERFGLDSKEVDKYDDDMQPIREAASFAFNAFWAKLTPTQSEACYNALYT